MRLNSFIFACALFLAFTAGWLLGALPQSAMLLGKLIPSDDVSVQIDLADLMKNYPSRRVVKIVAEIESIRDPFNVLSDIHPGDLITGTYIFDMKARDITANSTSGNYQFASAPSGVILQVGSHRFGTDQRDVDFNISVENLESGNQFSFISRNNICQPKLGNDDCRATVGLIWWCVHDFTGRALQSDELPQGSLDLANWNSLVGLRIEGTATDLKSKSTASFLIAAKVTRSETINP